MRSRTAITLSLSIPIARLQLFSFQGTRNAVNAYHIVYMSQYYRADFLYDEDLNKNEQLKVDCPIDVQSTFCYDSLLLKNALIGYQ